MSSVTEHPTNRNPDIFVLSPVTLFVFLFVCLFVRLVYQNAYQVYTTFVKKQSPCTIFDDAGVCLDNNVLSNDGPGEMGGSYYNAYHFFFFQTATMRGILPVRLTVVSTGRCAIAEGENAEKRARCASIVIFDEMLSSQLDATRFSKHIL